MRTATQNGNQGTIRFGVFDADLRTHELRKQGTRVRLPRQSFQILHMLLERPGELVTREELQKLLWPGDTFVDFDHGLNNAVKRIRTALGDSAETPRYIETLPRMGYRFMGPIETNGNGTLPSGTSAVVAVTPAALPAAASASADAPTKWRTTALAMLVLLVVATGFGYFSRRSARHEQPELTLIPLTSYPGAEIAPTFSPDGNQIAFAWNGGEHRAGFDVYVKVIGTETPAQLTHQPGPFVVPSWSPDGRFIAVERLNSERGSSSGIFLIPAVGGVERKLMDLAYVKYMYALALTWTPDSKWIAFSKATESEFHSSLVLLNVDTLEQRTVAGPSARCEALGLAAFSSDGKSMAFACMYSFGLSAIFVQPFPVGTARPLQELKGDLQGLIWTNDGRSLIYSLDRNLWRVPVKGGKTERLWFGQGASMPTLARRENRLAYVHEVHSVDIWRIALTGRGEEPTRLFPSNLVQQNPQYSPDGKKIAFESTRSGTQEIWACEADGSQPLQLTSLGGALTGTPRWSPDGQRIVFDSRASGRPELYVVGASGGTPRMLATTSTGGSVPYWSHDGKWIYFTAKLNREDQVFKVPEGGGTPIQLTHKGGFMAKESSDGQRLYYTNLGARNQIWSVQVDGQDEHPLENLPEFSWPAWDVGRRGIYYFDALHPDGFIHFYDFAAKRSRPLARLPGLPEPFSDQISLSPDEKDLVYSQTTEYSSDITLVEGFR
jgi:Tol biopolymer transport system component/DNA-binding winged helix-turn-helix (wHTH) protein